MVVSPTLDVYRAADARRGGAVVGRSAKDAVARRRAAAQRLDVADAVLKGQSEAVVGEDAQRQFRGGRRGVAVDEDDGHVDRADVALGGSRLQGEQEVAVRRRDQEAIGVDRGDVVRIGIEQDNVLAGPGEARSEGGAHGSGADDDDAHAQTPCPTALPPIRAQAGERVSPCPEFGPNRRRRRTGKSSMPKRSWTKPQRPRGAFSMTTMATGPRIIR